MSLANLRNPSEKLIAVKIVDDALAAGYTISVYDGEAYPVKRSADADTILGAMASTEMDTLVFRKDGERIGSVVLIYGNGHDLISDYTDNEAMEALLAPATELADELASRSYAEQVAAQFEAQADTLTDR